MLTLGRVLARTAIDEDIFLPVVPMDIAAEPQLPLLLYLLDQHLGEIDCRMSFLRRLDPLSIQIRTRQITPIVPNNNSINIEHRHNLKHKVISQILSRRMVAQQELNNVLNNMRGHGLAGMHSRCEHDCFLVFQVCSVLADCYVVAAGLGTDYLLPASVRQRNFLWKRFFFIGSCYSPRRKRCSCVYVYG